MPVIVGNTSTNNNIIITLPQNAAQFFGSVTLSASIAAGFSSGQIISYPTVRVYGAQDLPNGAIIAQVALATPPISLLSLLGVSSGHSITIPGLYILKNPTAESLYFKLEFSGATAACATMVGEYGVI